MNPNNLQAVQNQQAGREEQLEDIDLDSVYGGIDIDTTPPPMTPEMKKSYSRLFADEIVQTGADIGKQLVKETLIGAGGTFGDLAELAGVRQQFPGRDVRSRRESEVLNRMDQPGYQPSLQDFTSLESEDELMPSGTLPSSQTLREVNKSVGGIGEPKTKSGKYAQRVGQIYGSGLALGQINPVPALAAGVAGQTVEQVGGGPLAQGAVEIFTLLASGGKGGKAIPQSASKQIRDKIAQLKELGYTEQDITLAINSASKGKSLGVRASKGAATEKAFEESASRSDKLIGDILKSEIPGIEKGTKNVHEVASEAYGKVAEEASKLKINDSRPFRDSVAKVTNELKKTLGKNPEAESFLKRLTDAAQDTKTNPTAESFMNFYKELNSMGSWMGRSQKDRVLTEVKNGIKDTFKAQGKEGRQFAEKFEKANEGIRKAYRGEEVADLIQKATTQDGIDYKKMNKLFDNLDNIELFEEVLGSRQARNLQLISNTGKEIADFDKAWKATTSLPDIVENSAIGLGSLYYIAHGDWDGLAKTVALKGLSKGGKKGVRKLAEKSLTDPKFQNIQIRLLHSLKNESPRSFQAATNSMKNYFDEQGIEID